MHGHIERQIVHPMRQQAGHFLEIAASAIDRAIGVVGVEIGNELTQPLVQLRAHEGRIAEQLLPIFVGCVHVVGTAPRPPRLPRPGLPMSCGPGSASIARPAPQGALQRGGQTVSNIDSSLVVVVMHNLQQRVELVGRLAEDVEILAALLGIDIPADNPQRLAWQSRRSRLM